MTTRILKYPLPVEGDADLQLPPGAKLLSIGFQRGDGGIPRLVLWAEVDPAPGPREEHSLVVLLTGDYVPSGATYFATASFDAGGSPYVVHVYRRTP